MSDITNDNDLNSAANAQPTAERLKTTTRSSEIIEVTPGHPIRPATRITDKGLVQDADLIKIRPDATEP